MSAGEGLRAEGVEAVLATHLPMPCSRSAHMVSRRWWQCYGCDWTSADHPEREDEATHRAHVAAEIVALLAESAPVADKGQAHVDSPDTFPERVKRGGGDLTRRADEGQAAALSLRSTLREHAPLPGLPNWCSCGHRGDTAYQRETHMVERILAARGATRDGAR